MHTTKRRLRLLALLLVIPFLGLSGCEKDETAPSNSAPVISGITASATTVNKVEKSTITVNATDEEGDPLSYSWSSTGGSLSSTTLQSVDWTAPEAVGVFVITVKVDDGKNVAQASINIGVEVYVPSVQPYYVGKTACQGCHNTTEFNATFDATGHANAHLPDGQVFCLSCHETGYDTTVDNGGYDEIPFDEFEGIQCESCHGPGSSHAMTPSEVAERPALTIDPSVCQPCHSSSHTTFWADWSGSAHGSGSTVTAPGGRGGSTSCSACHSGDGYVDKVNGLVQTARTDYHSITCATCHDPHGSDDAHQIRMMDQVTMANGLTLTKEQVGLGLLCVNCHDGRRTTAQMTGAINDGGSSHWGPHHGGQGPIIYRTLVALDVAPPGFVWADSRHGNIEDVCVTCHLAGEENAFTGHSFEPSIEACEPCHGPLTSFEDILAKNDYDGDGTVEGVQLEVDGLTHGLIDAILAAGVDTTGYDTIEVFGYPAPTLPDTTYASIWAGLDPSLTPVDVRKAFWNLLMVEDDLSRGVHNASFVIQLLQQSIKSMGTALPGKELSSGGY